MQSIPVKSVPSYRRYDATPNPASTSKLHVIVPLSLALVAGIAGTGGTFGAQNISYATSLIHNPIIEVRGHQPKRERLTSIAQQVSLIRDALGLKMSELAQIFGVTRPTAYAWLNGADPKPELKIKILRVNRLVNDLHAANILKVERYCRLPLDSGESLIDALKSGSNWDAAVSAIKRTAFQSSAPVSRPERGPAGRKRTAGLDEISSSIVG